MKRHPLFAILFAAIMMYGGLMRGALAQQFYNGPVIDEVQLSVPFVRQDTLVWCWVAAAKMVAESLGNKTPSQCEMLEDQYGAPCCSQPWLCNRPGHISEIQDLINTFGHSLTGLSTSGTAQDLFDALQDSRAPLVAWVDGSHFVVITGMKIVPTGYGPTAVVRINDPIRGRFDQPWPAFSHRLGAVLAIER
jgi:Papain-like cysteine protease AvrRpt2